MEVEAGQGDQDGEEEDEEGSEEEQSRSDKELEEVGRGDEGAVHQVQVTYG